MKAFHHKNNTPSNSIQDSIVSHGTRNPFFVKSNSSLQQSFIQTKLSVNQPGDVYEKEADEMADKVVRNANDYSFNSGRESPGAFFNKPSSSVQRKCAECEKEEKEKKLQTKSDTTSPQTAPSSIESSLSSSKGSGSSLPAAVRAEMENSFSADFSGVKVHNDSSAIQMNKDLHAQAFTHGSDIYFNSGKYNTNSNSGKHLLAHELTHVVQQNNHSGQIRKGSNPSFLSLSSSIQQNQIQLEPNDRHDLTSAQLGGNAILEKAFDHETVISTVNHSKGNHVKKLQDALVQLGIELPEGTKEGTYDKGTEDAVKEFQQKASMSEKESDGIVGRKTIGLMDRSLRNNTISPDEDKAEDDLKLTDPKKKSLDEACKGKPIDEACPVPNTNVNTGADDAIKRIDKVINEQLEPQKTDAADYPAIFTRLFRKNDTRPIKETSDEVKRNFRLIRSFILKLKTDPKHVRCATECDGGCRSESPAYHSRPEEKNIDIITFCPKFSKEREKISIVIHESHHAAIKRSRDLAYQHTRLIDKLDHAEALRNAASFHLYAALVEDPKSDFIGQKVKDTNSIANISQQEAVDKALSFVEQWFRLVTFDMSEISKSMQVAHDEGHYPEKSRIDLINGIYVKWFNVTRAPGKPTEKDVTTAKAIEERANKMRKIFLNPFTITESATISEWERGPGKKIQLNQALLNLDINHMVIALLQELVHATPDISAESEPLFVGTVNDLRNSRQLAP